ncbi:MAG TPA: substrate-binding domain-containing protein [Solirubrobacteraceae bacterium]|jgi:ABC-type phosphate transport system substrate-binding protein
MSHFSARRLVPSCIIAAAGVAALVAPGAANATIGTQCSGSNIGGQGSSLQKLAQELWIPNFNTSAEKHACNGTQGTKGTPTVAYNSTGSGAGLKSWGVGKVEHKFGATNSFVGTDEAPNPKAKAEIEENETTLTPKALLTIPVLQAAVAVIVHLPANCVATSTSNKGRLVLNNSTLEGIWRGTITKWSEITDGGDKLSGTGCNAETGFTHVVRLDGSGTTHVYKKYLGLINKSTSWPATNVKGESVGNKTWDETAEGVENQTWPTADAVVRPEKTGNGPVVAKVAETAGSIAYANLADTRANAAFVPPTGGPNKATFWVPIQNKTGTVTYADPSSNKEVALLREANCAKTEYTNGEVAFPPANAQESWSEVTTKTEEPHYPICGLTFDLAFGKYSAFEGTSLEEATTTNNYLQYALDTIKEKEGNKVNGGQSLIKNHDYEPLTGTVLKEAQKGAALIAF